MGRLTVGIVALSVFVGGCTRVGPGYVGVKVSMAGDSRGVDSVPSVTGWNFYNPLATNIYEYPIFVRTAVWTQSLAEGHATNEEITFTNADKMKISVDVSLAYHLDPNKVPYFYVKFRTDDLDTFTHGFLRNLARDHFDHSAGKYSIDQIMGDNAEFISDVRTALQAELTPIGVILDQFGIIGAPRPPQAVIDQINASVHATQLTTQKQNELKQVQADMAKEREKTDTYARNTLTLAEAQATANRKLADSITPNLVQYRALEKWNGALPTVSSGAVPFINVGGNK